MMKALQRIVLFVLIAGLAACSDEVIVEQPDPQTLTREALGYFCGMIVTDHPGPKGQVILSGKPEALWFSSVRDTLAFTRLPEETDKVGAIYVTDLSRAASWENPGEDAWIEIQDALYVVGSARRGGMGAPEVAPFSDRAAAEAFAAEYGGKIHTIDEIPDEALLGAWEEEDGTTP